MTRHDKLTAKIMCGTSDSNIPFDDLCGLLRSRGFDERVRGDHHIFTRDGVEEILNLQPKLGMTKPYQVRQVRGVFLRYKLGDSDA